MLLGEALNKRAELQKRIQFLSEQIPRNLTYVANSEGDPIDEDNATASRYLSEWIESQRNLQELITKINLTNAKTMVPFQNGHVSITELIARREILGTQAKFYSGLTRHLQGYVRTSTNTKAAFDGLSAYELAKSKKEGVGIEEIKAAQALIKSQQEEISKTSNRNVLVLTHLQSKDAGDKFSKLVRETDTLLQKINWVTELL